MLVIGVFVAIGYELYGNTPGFGIMVAIGTAVEKFISPLFARIIGRK
jgi:hypothetical protein